MNSSAVLKFEANLKRKLSSYFSKDTEELDTPVNGLFAIFESIEELGEIGGWLFDISKQEIYWTKRTYEIYGLPYAKEITPELAISFYDTDARDIIQTAFQDLLENNKEYNLELSFVDSNKNLKWVSTTGKLYKENSVAQFVYGSFKDITEFKRLTISESNLGISHKAILDNVNDCIITSDKRGIILSANSKVKNIFGYRPDELIGKKLNILMPEKHARLHDKYMQSYQTTGRAKIIGVGRELPALRKNGEQFPMELSLSEVLIDNEKAYIGIVKDISEKKKAERKIEAVAFSDSVTSLNNYNRFKVDFELEVRKAENSSLHLYAFIIKLDKLSSVNMAFGRETGDALLKAYSVCLKETFKNTGSVYRYSSDKFLVLYPSTTENTVQEKLYLLQKDTCQNYDLNGHSVGITASVGVVDILKYSPSRSEVIQLLEATVKAASQDDSSFYKILEESDLADSHLKTSTLKEMKSGHFLDELSIVLQPQFNENEELFASEVLVRWYNRKLGNVPPDLFIPLAEESGSIVELGDFVINKTADVLSAIYERTKKYQKVAINVSARQLLQPDFCSKLKEAFKLRNIPFSSITVEVTESVLISSLESVHSKMNELTKLGFEFSIDDFGTGYSSLNYIMHMPIRELKIDRTFIKNIGKEDKSEPIIKAILSMTKSLELRTVAEGIESQEQLAYLKQYNCDVYQGYYYAKPLPIEQWMTLVEGVNHGSCKDHK
ncbi:GGDEF domain-containing protein [Pseudoalteromonas sp. PS1M3]|jgi:PAS domain S-box-containing protein/diguanylate cyclase (GGDEF)-like protein|uniref:sensor domain-containing protein n=1 Tax=Pseudoalteromonas sp. PS1M3 TaxID=87791 RepID=UPI001951C28A|nr:GGDEF domain-containing phosphodiesterase [Pseudoalteromonas sp. PS1M3]BBW90865.1 GGDEF domain-containing protein [Pseudoalteromonas sp. PS1M3]